MDFIGVGIPCWLLGAATSSLNETKRVDKTRRLTVSNQRTAGGFRVQQVNAVLRLVKFGGDMGFSLYCFGIPDKHFHTQKLHA
jgi:hypothetical protein